MIPSISYPTEKTQSNLSEMKSVKPIRIPTVWQSTGEIDKKRLIILIPPQISDGTDLSEYILKLASADNSDVLLIMLVSSYEDETIGHLRIANITTYINGFHFKVESQIVWGKSWLNAVKQFIQPGDAIVCPTELNTKTRVILREPLSDQLVHKLNVPVNTYSGFVSQVHTSPWEIVKKLVYWVGIILIVVGFFYIETTIDKSIIGWVNNFVEVLLVLLEVGALYLWSSFLG